MGFDDALNKAKDFAGDHKDQTNDAIDGANKKAQDLAPDQLDGGIDQGATSAKDFLGTGDDK
ncbi:antitoxin [Brachybacterium sp. AOP25-B2-12]|uniref:antitoxin n=1 Tax=Brachybacterium sp. AOP25-B2-12 TaxID=3457710 RepID=UPI0040343472